MLSKLQKRLIEIFQGKVFKLKETKINQVKN